MQLTHSNLLFKRNLFQQNIFRFFQDHLLTRLNSLKDFSVYFHLLF
ncbi:hypothetical protein LEP1GSC059_4223 [Leptospira noguchii serovar Panama str. CZ214]|uniref:Uncharacterized protein n=1 Tax=Leptospira noguchii serovar Panama str. CZ214 TaxID=1001595 RepID=T0GMW6_9LEPT|nr:hypothetical protein LEP1GSC059_4223 [Leptospira noguchii serovar Panama str. CZ214]